MKTVDLKKMIFSSVKGLVGLVVLASIVACLISACINLKREIRFDYAPVIGLSNYIEEQLLKGNPDAFIDLHQYAYISNNLEAYIYAVIDKETGEDVYPKGINPAYKNFDYEGSKQFRGKIGEHFYYARNNGILYFSMYSDMQNFPYRLIFTCPFSYAFSFAKNTIVIFFACLLLMLVIVLAYFRFKVLPSLGKSIHEQHMAELELSNAARIQHMAITRDFPVDPRCDVYGLLKPAREVGGDLYGCIIQDNHLYFIIGDVSDKGTSAAFVMFLLSSMAYPMFKEGRSMSEVAKELNNVLCDNPNYDMFCTAILGCINLETKMFRFINAGHTRMLLDGEFVDVEPNMPLGVIRDYPFEVESRTLPVGSTLLLYTDGVTEERSESRDFFGENGMLEWWKGLGVCSAKEICESLDTKVDLWSGSSEQSDDRAILTIKLL